MVLLHLIRLGQDKMVAKQSGITTPNSLVLWWLKGEFCVSLNLLVCLLI